jgi:hypothetical protein
VVEIVGTGCHPHLVVGDHGPDASAAHELKVQRRATACETLMIEVPRAALLADRAIVIAGRSASGARSSPASRAASGSSCAWRPSARCARGAS